MRSLARPPLPRITFATLVLGVTALIAAGCSTTQTVGTQISDADIEAEAETRIAADPQLNPFEIDVDSEEGIVRLSGMVDDLDDVEAAEELVRNVDGVRGVDNDLTFGEQAVEQRISDARLTSTVKSRLAADPAVVPTNVNVDVEAGVVTLTGRVETAEAKRRAEEIAAGTDGVLGVENLLRVGDMADD